MKKTTAIIIVLLFATVIVLLVIFGKDEQVSKDLQGISVAEDKIKPSNAAFQEFQELKATAKTFEEIPTVVVNTGDSKKLCDSQTSPHCLTVIYQTFVTSWKFVSIYFVEKPMDGDVYLYEQLGDSPLVMKYTDENWKLSEIEYLKNAEIRIVKIADTTYPTFLDSQGDGGVSDKIFMIDPLIDNFPYWIKIVYRNECCVVDDSMVVNESNQLEKDIAESLRMSNY